MRKRRVSRFPTDKAGNSPIRFPAYKVGGNNSSTVPIDYPPLNESSLVINADTYNLFINTDTTGVNLDLNLNFSVVPEQYTPQITADGIGVNYGLAISAESYNSFVTADGIGANLGLQVNPEQYVPLVTADDLGINLTMTPVSESFSSQIGAI